YNTGAVSTSVQNTYGGTYSAGVGGVATNCYNVGKVTGSSGKNAIASAQGSGCYYLTGTGNSNTGSTALTEAQMKIQSVYVSFDFENTWVLDPGAVYPYPQLQANPQNLEEGVEIMGLISWPLKLEYYVGEELDLTGCMMDITYNSGRQELILVTADMVSGYDKYLLGDQTITVSYNGGTDTFEVTVIARPEIASIEMATMPNKTEFVVRTAFDFAGAQIKLNYADGSSEVIDVAEDMISGGNINKLGKQTITVTFDGKTTTFQVTVKSASAETLRIDQLPTKLVYLEGEALDLTGLTMTVIMNNGTQYAVSSGYTVTGYSGVPGTQTVTVTYLGVATSFQVTVAPKSVVKLTVQNIPAKTSYLSGEKLNLAGLVLVAEYDNGTQERITDYTVSGFDGIPGTKDVTLSAYGLTTTFEAQVEARAVNKLEDLTTVSVNANDETHYMLSTDLCGMMLWIRATDGVTVTINGTVVTPGADGYEIELLSQTELVVKNGNVMDLQLDAYIEEKIVVQKFDIDVARMILGNALEFQFGVSITKIPDKTGYYAVIEKTWADGTTTTKTIPADQWGTAGQYHAIVYDGLAAKEMSDTFYVTIYNADGVEVSNAKQDAVRDYVERAYASQSATGKTMMVDMLNYGAAAQVHFDYGTSDLANSQLTAEQLATGTSATPAIENKQVKGENYSGTRFILTSRIQVQIGFKGLKNTMYAIYSYTNNNGIKQEIRVEGVDFVASGSSKIGVELSSLVYSDARALVEVTIYNADGSVYGTAVDSIESCVFRSTGDVFVALMKFADSAKAHLYG
ncbi:MAG: bacterial Ig-like domain-containing protein, partial [Oscillospiraceae bacterium]|nr:bacterial Ig-like domain-containing protein [Oscillospiraceae bacterium]